MASPQCEDGYTRIANELLEALCRVKLTLYEWRVLMAIIRFTYGYNRKVNQISVRQICSITDIDDPPSIYKAIRTLEAKGMITVSKQNNRLILGIQKDYEQWAVGSSTNVGSSANVGSRTNTKLDDQPTPALVHDPTSVLVDHPISTPSGVPENDSQHNGLDGRAHLPKDNIKNIYKDNIKDNILFPCAEDQRQGSPPKPPVITIPLIHKKEGRPEEYPVSRELVSELQTLYPAVDVIQALREIRAWNLANPRNRKTRSGILRHINTWLKKEQDRAHRSRDDPADVTAGLRKWAARYGIETPGLEGGHVDQD